jgi:beta-glucosidase
MPPSDVANVEIDGILNRLSTEEAVNLIAGVGPWHTFDRTAWRDCTSH